MNDQTEKPAREAPHYADPEDFSDEMPRTNLALTLLELENLRVAWAEFLGRTDAIASIDPKDPNRRPGAQRTVNRISHKLAAAFDSLNHGIKGAIRGRTEYTRALEKDLDAFREAARARAAANDQAERQEMT